MKVRAMRVRARDSKMKRAGDASLKKLFRSIVEAWEKEMKDFWGGVDKSLEALSEFQAELESGDVHRFEVGDHATRDGTDVQLVISVDAYCAEFKCIKAPFTGWTEVGEVEYNLMRRYMPLTAEEVRSMMGEAEVAS